MQYQIQERTSWFGFAHFINESFPVYILIIGEYV